MNLKNVTISPIDRPLFTVFPALKAALNPVALGQLPTPLMKAVGLGKKLGISNIYIKCDNLSGGIDGQGRKLFGGNKVRKLEFVLGHVLKNKYTSVLCYGGIASNNVVAVSTYAHQLGLKSIALLMPQAITRTLQRNLLLDLYYGCSLFECPAEHELTPQEVKQFLHEQRLDPNTFVIPTGSSNVLGVIGYVNAAFELKEQIRQGLIPEPDYLYVAFGSMGTVGGLLLGIKAAGLKTQVKAVRVSGNERFNSVSLCALIQETNAFLYDADPSFALFEWHASDCVIIDDFLGNGYAHSTEQAESARDLFKTTEDILLDESYTAKAAAALISDCEQKNIPAPSVLLFWNTFCADDFAQHIATLSYHNVPGAFQKYFTSF